MGRGKSKIGNDLKKSRSFEKAVKLSKYVKNSLNTRIGKLQVAIDIVEHPEKFAYAPSVVKLQRATANLGANKKKLKKLEYEKELVLKKLKRYRQTGEII